MAPLLFDEPLSEQLCDSLADIFPGSLHIRWLGHGGVGDPIVWELAREHGCIIVSKDGDFTAWPCCAALPRSSSGFGLATVGQAMSQSFFDAGTRTSRDSTSRTKPRYWNWVEHRRPNERVKADAIDQRRSVLQWPERFVVSVWFVRKGEDIPRFVRAYPGGPK